MHERSEGGRETLLADLAGESTEGQAKARGGRLDEAEDVCADMDAEQHLQGPRRTSRAVTANTIRPGEEVGCKEGEG